MGQKVKDVYKRQPQIEVKSRRVGGATFKVPTEIRPDRKESILSLIHISKMSAGVIAPSDSGVPART